MFYIIVIHSIYCIPGFGCGLCAAQLGEDDMTDRSNSNSWL